MRRDKKILVVDDDDAVRALVSTVLRRRGFGVNDARNGREAVATISECRYALVILDLMMPQMSGYEVLAHVAAMADTRRPLVLILTAGREPRDFDSSFVIGTVRKPFDIELLVDTVTGCLTTMPEHSRAGECRSSAQVASAPEEPN